MSPTIVGNVLRKRFKTVCYTFTPVNSLGLFGIVGRNFQSRSLSLVSTFKTYQPRSLMPVQPQHYFNKDLKKIQALSWIPTHDLCDAGAVLSELSYQSHMRAVATLLEQRPEKNSGSERDSNPRLRCRCSALPTELSKPHESSRIRVNPLYVDIILGPSIEKSEINFVH